MTIQLTTPSPEEQETVVLFEIDGKEYRVAAKPRAGIALQYLKEVRDNEQLANTNMLINLLGEENYDALAAWEGLTNEILDQVLTAATALLTGQQENPKARTKRSTS